MAHDATTLVKSRRFGSTSVKAIMLVLADYADTEWSCFVGQRRLAFEAEVGERTVRRILADLEARGMIRRHRRVGEGGFRTSDRIVLVGEAIRSLPAMVAGDGSAPDLPATGDRLPAIDDRLPATGDRPTGQSLAGEPLEEPSVRTTSKNHGAGALIADLAEARRRQPAPSAFEEFWSVYPRHTAKGAARTAWAKALKKADADTIIAGAVAYRDDPNRHPAFTKNPATWLNGECWNDDPLPARGDLAQAGPRSAITYDRSAPSGRLKL